MKAKFQAKRHPMHFPKPETSLFTIIHPTHADLGISDKVPLHGGFIP